MINRNDVPLPVLKNKPKKEQTKKASKYPNGYFKEKPCRWCETYFQPSAPSEHYCSDKCKDYAVADAYIQRNYNISLTNYQDLYIEQNGKCKLCGSKGFKIKESHSMLLVIDHNHLTGAVRGLLCHNCNRALGLFKDDISLLKKGIEYLSKPDRVFENTQKSMTRRRVSSNTKISVEKGVNLLTDIFENKLITSDLVKKYGITKETINNIKTRKSREDIWERYCQSATTIPSGSTSQTNGDGSGSLLTDNAEDDDIVSPV